jgi:hypothetical protein
MADASTVLLVGTRVAGDTMPRPFLAVAISSGAELMQAGYALVAGIDDSTGEELVITYIGER